MARTELKPTAKDSEVQFMGARKTANTKAVERPIQTRSASQKAPIRRYGSPILQNDEDESDTEKPKSDHDKMDGDYGNRKSSEAVDSKRGHRSKRMNIGEDKVWERLWRKEDEIQHLKEMRQKKTESYAKLKNEDLQKAKDQKNGKQDTISQLKAEAEDRDEEIKTLKEQLLAAEETIHKKDVKITKLVNERMEILTKSDIPAQPDNVVRDSAARLFLRVKKWATQRSIKNWSGVSSETATAIANRLQEDQHTGFASDRMRAAAEKGKIPPRIIVNALVNYALCQDTFLSPFDIFEGNLESENESAGVLQCTHDLLRTESPALRHRLRALCVRSLRFPEASSAARLSEAAEKYITELRSNHLEHITQHIANTAVPLLLDDAGPELRQAGFNELTDIITDFISFFIESDSQYPAMVVRFRKSLLDFKFTAKHSYFTAHRALKLRTGDDEDDIDNDYESAEEAGIEGNPIDLVVEPTVLRVGDEDGTRYDRTRILTKAVVWMVRPTDLTAKSTVGTALMAKEQLARNQPVNNGSTHATPAIQHPSLLQETLSSMQANTTTMEGNESRNSTIQVVIPVSQERKETKLKANMQESTSQKPAALPKPQHAPSSNQSQSSNTRTEAHRISQKAPRRSMTDIESAPSGVKRAHDEPYQPDKRQCVSSLLTDRPDNSPAKTTPHVFANQLLTAAEITASTTFASDQSTGSLVNQMGDAWETQEQSPVPSSITVKILQELQTTIDYPYPTPSSTATEKPDVDILKEADIKLETE